jgi:hypothetical protein
VGIEICCVQALNTLVFFFSRAPSVTGIVKLSYIDVDI